MENNTKLLDLVDKKVLGIFWLTEKRPASSDRYFNELDYLVDGLLSDSVRKNSSKKDNDSSYSQELFLGKNFESPLFLYHSLPEEKNLTRNFQNFISILKPHNGDNSKLIIIANEKGYNVYKKVADSRCSVAKEWWTEHNDKWQSVRNKWDEVFSRNVDLTLAAKVDNKPLYTHLFSDDITIEDEMNKIIVSFIKK